MIEFADKDLIILGKGGYFVMAVSEVSQLREKITLENDAAHYGLSGLASGVSRHEFIEARMERMGRFLQATKGDNKDDNIKQYEQEVALLQKDLQEQYGVI
jgi:hypothetical protein